MLPLDDFCVAEAVIAADEHTVAGLQTFQHLIMLRVLPSQLDGHAPGTVLCFIHPHNPLPARLGVEVAAWEDEPPLRLPQLDLQTEGETLA